MTPKKLLNHRDNGTLWPARAPSTDRSSLDTAYATALAVRAPQHFLVELRACPGAPDLQPNGHWQAHFSRPGFHLALHTTPEFQRLARS